MTPTLFPSARFEVVESLGDRCDRCGASAKLAVQLANGGELAFCGHHANRHTDDIVRVALNIALEEGFRWAGETRVRG